MNGVERWYRVALAAYPPDYLAEREEELVATLLAATPPAASRPPVRELVALVVNGVGERAARCGGATRRQGLAVGGLLALAGASTIVTMVIVGQLSDRWLAPLPRAFWPGWGMLAVLVAAARLAHGRLARTIVAGVLVVAGAGLLLLGPAALLVSRRHLAAAVLFGVVAASPGARRPMPTLAGVAVGALAGWRIAAIGLHRAGSVHERFRQPWLFDFGMLGQTNGAGFLVVLTAVAVLLAWFAPRVGLALAVNVVPVGLMVNAFSTSIAIRAGLPADPGVLVVGLTLVGVLAVGLSSLASTRRREPIVRRRVGQPGRAAHSRRT